MLLRQTSFSVVAGPRSTTATPRPGFSFGPSLARNQAPRAAANAPQPTA
jgi:hypothetical protein